MSINNYQQLYMQLREKYEDKEKENKQLKVLLKLKDKEIISLKCKIKSFNNINNNEKIYNKKKTRDNSLKLKNNEKDKEISKNYLEFLIKTEIENIKKEQIKFINKILTSENYELQILAPKLTTANTNTYNFLTDTYSKKSLNSSIDEIYIDFKKNPKKNNKNMSQCLFESNKQQFLTHKGNLNDNIDIDNNDSLSYRTNNNSQCYINMSLNNYITYSKK